MVQESHESLLLWDVFLPDKAEACRSARSLYDLVVTSIEGTSFSLAQCRGKPLLVVNSCEDGHLDQYDELRRLSEIYRIKDLTVLILLSQDFDSEYIRYALRNMSMNSLVVARMNTEATSYPFFRWLRQEYGWSVMPRWHFQKYLISPEGELESWFLPSTRPMSRRIIHALEKHLH